MLTVSDCTPSGTSRSTLTVPAGFALRASSTGTPASSQDSLTKVSKAEKPEAIPPATRLSSMPGSICLVALRRASHMRSPAMPFRCTACVVSPNGRAAARSISNASAMR